MNAPRLLHVFATFAATGPQLRTVELMRALGPRFRHAVLAMDGNVDAFARVPPGLGVRRLAAPPRRFLRRVAHLRSLIAAEQPDLLLTYNWGSFDAVLAARTLYGIRHVHHEDGFNQDEAQALKARRTLLRRMFLRRAARVVVVSERLQAIAAARWRVPFERIEFIPNGIRAERFGAGDGAFVREQFRIPESARVIGAVGTLRPVKNVARLLRAAAGVPAERLGGAELHVLVVGDGPERAELEALAARLPELAGRVHFAGYQAELADFYAAMDALGISSDSEQQPIALLEAMAAGRAVVSTDVGDVRSMLCPEQRPYVVPMAADAGELDAALARAFGDLLADGAARAALGTANRRLALDRYTFDGMLARYRSVYEAALAGS